MELIISAKRLAAEITPSTMARKLTPWETTLREHEKQAVPLSLSKDVGCVSAAAMTMVILERCVNRCGHLYSSDDVFDRQRFLRAFKEREISLSVKQLREWARGVSREVIQ